MSETERRLLEAIIADPAADDLRLIYADWCEESGQVDRATWIREWFDRSQLRCRPSFTHNVRTCPRCVLNDRLIASTHSDWVGGPWMKGDVTHTAGSNYVTCGQGQTIIIDRGFLQEISCLLKSWLMHGPAVAKSQPIEYVRIYNREPLLFVANKHPAVWFRDMADVTDFGGQSTPAEHRLPGIVFDYLLAWECSPATGSEDFYLGSYYPVLGKYGDLRYASVEHATAALSRGLIRMARRIPTPQEVR